MENKCIAVIPVYNEAKSISEANNLDAVIEASLQAQEKRIIDSVVVVDDGSTDFSADRLSEYEPDIKVLHHKNISGLPENKGKLEAVRTGIRYARREGAEIIVFADADFNNPDPSMYKKLLAPFMGFFGLRYDMTVADYLQENTMCGYCYSGLRAVRTPVFNPWFSPSHRDYRNWSYILKPKNIEAGEFPDLDFNGRQVITGGFALETLLEGMKKIYRLNTKEIPFFGLTSRKKGDGACRIDEINTGISWGASLLAEFFDLRSEDFPEPQQVYTPAK